jgi:predicted hydrocarbon binding protein
LRAFKVALKSATIYHHEHAAIGLAVVELKKKIDALFEWMDPIKIGFTPRSLRVDEEYWEGDKLYEEVARTFHQRKIKSLEIRQGLRTEELRDFVLNFYLPVKEIAKRGGFKNILRAEDIIHLAIEELDYSQLLKGEGEDIPDVWAYLLQEALDEQAPEKMDELADNFERVIPGFDLEDIDKDERLGENFSRFFAYLKDNNKVKFKKCAKDLVRAVIRDKRLSFGSNIERLKSMVSDLTEKDLAPLLYDEMVTDDDFDALGFSLFSKLTDGDRDNKISKTLSGLAQKDMFLSSMTAVKNKIKRLLSGTESTFISENYRKSLGSLLEGITFEKKRTFDPAVLVKNYHALLLNLLDKETQKEAMVDLLEIILKEWAKITEEKDYDYLKSLWCVLERKKSVLGSEPTAQKIGSELGRRVETDMLEGMDLPVFDYFIDAFKAGTLDVNDYLRKIFTDHNISPYILRAFFKFHPDCMLYFYINLEQHAGKLKFLNRMIENLKKVDSPLSLMALKTIFPWGTNEIKVHVLKAMQNLSECDDKFLFPLLKKGGRTLKKEALAVVARFDALRPRAFKKLLGFESPFGLRNRLLLDHLEIIKELDLRPAKDFVLPLTQREFFWNKKLREKALRLLEDWDARKN